METLCIPNSGWLLEQSHGTTWTKEENKKFENALAYFDEKTPNRWIKVASLIPGKSVDDVVHQYQVLVADIGCIEAGLVPDPGYLASSFSLQVADDNRSFHVYTKRARSGDHERKKGVPWTEDEHRRFLLGLEKHGKGDWRSISRNFVISKTPTQVASHAQKYYLRQNSGSKDRRRPSIHDITIVDLTAPPPSPKNSNHLRRNAASAPKIESEWEHGGEEALMVLNSTEYPGWKHSISFSGTDFSGFEAA